MQVNERWTQLSAFERFRIGIRLTQQVLAHRVDIRPAARKVAADLVWSHRRAQPLRGEFRHVVAKGAHILRRILSVKYGTETRNWILCVLIASAWRPLTESAWPQWPLCFCQ